MPDASGMGGRDVSWVGGESFCGGSLDGSWLALAGAVLSTITSFLVSQRGIDVQLKKAEDYYLRDDLAALNKTGIAKLTDWINIGSGVLFVLGVLHTTAFVIVNLERTMNMSDNKKPDHVPLSDGATIPKMQEVEVKRGAPIPNLQQVPQNQQPLNQPAQSNTPTPPVSGTESCRDRK